MNERDLNYLKSCLAAGLLVYWIKSCGKLILITTFGTHPEESGPVGFIDDGPGFHYIAMDNVCHEDIQVMANVTKWPSVIHVSNGG